MTSLVDCPYVGLVPYTEEETRFFFGREQDQRVIISNLFASRLTILYGASGVGKSSVLRAGVIRELRDRSASEPDIAVVYLDDWKGDALSLLKQLITDEVTRLGHTIPSGIANRTLRDVLEGAAMAFDGDVMVILDQFEEYFLYHPCDLSPGTFAYEFAEAANDGDLPVSFMVSLRDDALSRLDRFKALIPNLFANYLRIGHLGREQARRAITGPIDAYNRLPASQRVHQGTMAVDPALVEAILDQVRQDRVLIGEAGRGVVTGVEAHGIETPYLQLVLKRVWAEETSSGSPLLRAETLARLGGAEEIVGTHVDAVLDMLAESDKAICARIFQFLVTPGGTKIAHALSDLSDFAGVSEADLMPVLERLSGSATRILSPVAATGAEGPMRYEIYHDSLAHGILDWRKTYVDRQDREEKEQQWAAETQRQRERLEQAKALAVAQQERAEAQTRNVRLLRAMLGALAVVAVIMLAIAGYALYQRRIATESEQRARVSAQLAQESAVDAQQARAAAAAAAALYAQAKGDATEAGKFRLVAEQARAEAAAFQKKTEANVTVVLDAQRQRDDLAARLERAQQEINRLRGGSPIQQTATPGPEVTLFVRLLRIDPLTDATTRGAWHFSVKSGNYELITRPNAGFDLGSESGGPNSDGRLPAREGATVTLTLRGASDPPGVVVQGSYAVYVKPLAQFGRDVVRVPLTVEGGGIDKPAVVVNLEIWAAGPSAR